MKFPKLSLKKKSAENEQTADIPSSTASSSQPGTSSSAGAKQWIILHIEKIVLVASVVIVVLLIYSAIGTLRPDSKHTPSALAKRANALDGKIQASGEEAAETPPDFVARVEAAKRRIAAGSYSFDSLTGVDAQKIRKRGRPQFLRLENLWASGGSGIFWLGGGDQDDKNPRQDAIPPQDAKPGQKLKVTRLSKQILPGVRMPAGAAGELKHWAVITAAVPVRDQYAIFEKNFRGTEDYNPREDIPKYLLARIQRIEVPVDTKNFEPDWSQPDVEWEWGIKDKDNSPSDDLPAENLSNVRTAVERVWEVSESDNWASEATEIVDPRFTHDELTTPLGPLAFADWHAWATHPDIPLAGQGVAREAEKPKPREKKKTNSTEKKATKKTKGKSSRRDKFLKKEQSQSATPPSSSEPPEVSSPQPKVFTEKNKLVRLFDFDVQPGKTYLYRIQLLLENPNYKKSPRVLKNPPDRKWALTPDAWLPWSEPSNPVSIPEAIGVYAGGVQKDAKGLDTATIFVSQPAASGGRLQIGKKDDLQQGGVIRGELPDAYAINGAGMPSKEAQQIRADIVLVDIRARKDGSQKTDVSELLFFDSGGQFMVRNTSEGVKQSSLHAAAAQGDAKRRKANEDKKKKGDKDNEDENRFGGKNPESPNNR